MPHEEELQKELDRVEGELDALRVPMAMAALRGSGNTGTDLAKFSELRREKIRLTKEIKEMKAQHPSLHDRKLDFKY